MLFHLLRRVWTAKILPFFSPRHSKSNFSPDTNSALANKQKAREERWSPIVPRVPDQTRLAWLRLLWGRANEPGARDEMKRAEHLREPAAVCRQAKEGRWDVGIPAAKTTSSEGATLSVIWSEAKGCAS